MEHFSAKILGTEVTLRDLTANDVETVVNYWHATEPAFLYSLGADLSKLTSRETTRERILDLRTRAYFVIASDRDVLAYTNLNFRSETEACAHFHVLQRTARIKAIMYVLFPEAFKVFFSCFPLERIEMQTLPANTSISRLLNRFGLKPQTQHLSEPDGLGRPGVFNVYRLTRAEFEFGRRFYASYPNTYKVAGSSTGGRSLFE